MDITSATNPLAKLRAAARKDPKKAGVLAVLVVVMGGLWAKALLHPNPAPAGAAALAPAGTPVPATPTFAAASDKPRVSSAARPAWNTIKLAPAPRNLFLVDYNRYEKAGKSTAAGAAVQQSGDSSSDPAKSGPTPADLKRERQILVANLQSQAEQLKLQTTLMGASPKALVNGNLVGEGDSVASFRIVKITGRGMVIEREGITFEVQMKK